MYALIPGRLAHLSVVRGGGSSSHGDLHGAFSGVEVAHKSRKIRTRPLSGSDLPRCTFGPERGNGISVRKKKEKSCKSDGLHQGVPVEEDSSSVVLALVVGISGQSHGNGSIMREIHFHLPGVEGGTCSWTLYQLAIILHQFCHDSDLMLRPTHLAGIYSGGRSVSGQFRQKRVVPVTALDLMFIWNGLSAYTYPQRSFLQRVLYKVEGSNVDLILVAPLWPGADLVSIPPSSSGGSAFSVPNQEGPDFTRLGADSAFSAYVSGNFSGSASARRAFVQQ